MKMMSLLTHIQKEHVNICYNYFSVMLWYIILWNITDITYCAQLNSQMYKYLLGYILLYTVRRIWNKSIHHKGQPEDRSNPKTTSMRMRVSETEQENTKTETNEKWSDNCFLLS